MKSRLGSLRVQVGNMLILANMTTLPPITYGCKTMGSPSRLVSCYNWVVLKLCFIAIHKALGNDDG